MKQNERHLFLGRGPIVFASVIIIMMMSHRALAGTSPRPSKPNFVIILIDDMGYGDVGAFNPKCKNRTPNIDRMASEGMKLTSFYAAPVCSPSRAQLLTGCYAKRVSLPQVLFPAEKIGLSAEEHTIAGLLKQQGYATMAIGKWHVGDQVEFLPTRRGFDHYLGLPYSNDMGGEWDGEADLPKGKRKYPPLPLVRDEKVIETLKGPDQEKLVQLYTDEAVKFIREHKAGPFFLYLPHTAVHVPIHPGNAFQGKSENGRYGDWVEEVDASTGRVLATLHELKLEENTLVIFTSDNGPWLTQGADGGNAGPLRGGKGGTFEGGMREPTIVRWPGQISAGTSTDAVAGEIDLLPTFVKLAGGVVPTDRKIDGADLSPILFGQSNESPRECHYFFDGNELQAVRAGPWKLAIAPQREATGRKPAPAKVKGPFVPTLYNLATDIGETTDVAAGHPDVVKRLFDFAAKMDGDLGLKKKGPGVRPPGRVEDPKPLLLKK
ncbi:MAG TPA: sulfatase [Humisphaera sp.]|nr:sulfatase [Humisphaera sp.]